MGSMISDHNINNADYNEFVERVKLERCQVYSPNRHIFRYYSYGVEKSPVIVFVPSTTCTPEIFYRQFLDLPGRGYKIFAVHYSVCTSHEDWARAFAALLDYEFLDKVHLVGCGLGGLLIQVFAQLYPARTLSMVLVNTYSDNEPYLMHPTQYSFQPFIVLKDNLLNNMKHGIVETQIAESILFVSNKFDEITREEVVSRLSLQCTHCQIKTPPIDSEKVTIVNTLDTESVSEVLQNKLSALYPQARTVLLKTGGDFPYFSRYEEFNMHIVVHMRRVEKWTPSGLHVVPSSEASKSEVSIESVGANSVITAVDDEDNGGVEATGFVGDTSDLADNIFT